MGLISFAFFPLIRLHVKKLLYKLTLMKRKVLIVGSGEAAINAYKAITNEPNLGYQIAGFIDDNPQVKEIKGIKVRSNISQIERYIKNAGIHDVIVAKTELSKEESVKLINHIQHKAENTLYIPDITGIAVSGTELRHFFREQAMFIEIKNNLSNPLIYGTKRVLDYIAGVIIFANIYIKFFRNFRAGITIIPSLEIYSLEPSKYI
jgi:undecaprenyl-phosphate galactose phosphotransferase